MNCRRFEDGLEERLDGTLSREEQAAMDQHAAECAACREVLRRRRQFGQGLSESFQQATQLLRLRPEIGRNVLRDLANQSSVPAGGQSIAWLRRLFWPWAAAAGFLVAAVWLVGPLAGPPKPGPAAHQTPVSAPNAMACIQVSYRLPIYTFQKEGVFVRDSLVYQTVIVNGRLWLAPNQKGKSQD